MENKNPIQVADRLFLVMEQLAETGPVTFGRAVQPSGFKQKYGSPAAKLFDVYGICEAGQRNRKIFSLL